MSSLPFGYPATPRPGWPSPTGRSGSWPRATRSLAGSDDPGGGDDLEPQDLHLRPLKPGETTEAVWKLSAVRAGKLHRPLPDRRRAQRHSQGRDPASPPAAPSPPRSPPNRRTPKSPTPAKSSKRRSSASGGARRIRRRQRVRCPVAALFPASAADRRAARRSACRPAAPPARPTSARPAAGPAAPGVGPEEVGNFDHPVYVTGAPGYPKLLFVVEQAGRVIALNGGKNSARPFLDIRAAVDYDGASAGSSRSPSRPTTRRAAASTSITTTRRGNIASTNSSARSATRAAPGRGAQVIRIPHPATPTTTAARCSSSTTSSTSAPATAAGGDPPNNAQNKDVLLGKLMRIDPRPFDGKPYTVPDPTRSSAARP